MANQQMSRERLLSWFSWTNLMPSSGSRSASRSQRASRITSEISPQSPSPESETGISTASQSPSHNASQQKLKIQTDSLFPSPQSRETARTASQISSPSNNASQPKLESQTAPKSPSLSHRPKTTTGTASETQTLIHKASQLKSEIRTVSPSPPPLQSQTATGVASKLGGNRFSASSQSLPPFRSKTKSTTQLVLQSTSLPPSASEKRTKDPRTAQTVSSSQGTSLTKQPSRKELQLSTSPTRSSHQPGLPSLEEGQTHFNSSRPEAKDIQAITLNSSKSTLGEPRLHTVAANLENLIPPESVGEIEDENIDKMRQSGSQTDTDEAPKARGEEAKRENFESLRSKAKAVIQQDMNHESTPQIRIQRNNQLEQQVTNTGKVPKIGSSEDKKGRSRSSEKRRKGSISQGEQADTHEEMREGVWKFIDKVVTRNPDRPEDETSVKVVTVAGENRGATMNAGPNAVSRESSMHIHRGYKMDKGNENETTGDKEGTSTQRSDARSTLQTTITCVNNNLQSINNSILCNSKCETKNPGVHLCLTSKTAEAKKPDGKSESLDAIRSRLKVPKVKQVNTEPTVRRRCLRGLLMEPSESDPDNPQKPQRHGCRYACPEKAIGKDSSATIVN